MNTTYLIIGVVVVLVILVAILSVISSRRKGPKRFNNNSGPEYERLLKITGDKKKAQAEMEERSKRVEAMNIHPLTASEHEQFQASWNAIQAKFIDQPGQATVEADALIVKVMKARGYLDADFEQHAADISVNYPDQVTGYRQAHEIALKNEQHLANTEELRQEFVSYRALFDELLKEYSKNEAVVSERT